MRMHTHTYTHTHTHTHTHTQKAIARLKHGKVHLQWFTQELAAYLSNLL